MKEKIYLESGISLHALCAGDEVRLLKTVEELFGSAVVSRENMLEFSGSDNACLRTKEFFESLVKLYRLRGKQLEQR